MKRFAVGGLMFAVFALVAVAEDKPAAKPASPANPHFERLKKLVGTWVAADEKGNPTDQVVSVIRLTGAGSALHETLFPGQPHEMISIYHLDGADVVMTHYCALGNQPRMKLDPAAPTNQFKWDFAGGTNLNPAKDKHMHGAVVTVLGDDRIELTGVAWEDGKPCEACACQMKLVRKK